MTRPSSTRSNATAEAAESKTRKPRATTLYPKLSLVDALRLAESIRDNNASSPYNRIDLAASVDLSPESSTLRTLITASNKFGLTEGSYAAEKISLTDLGRKIVSPTSDEEKAQGLMTALYKVDFYKDFFEQFKNHRLPRKDLLLNTLEREFNIPRADRDQCYELLVKNATELGLLKDVGGTPGKIRILIREAGASTRSAFESYFFDGKKPTYAPNAVEVTNIDQTVKAINSFKESIGMVTMSAVTFADPTIAFATIDGVSATRDNLNSGKYQVRRPLYLVYTTDPAKVKPTIQAFISFVKGPDGQKILAGL